MSLECVHVQLMAAAINHDHTSVADDYELPQPINHEWILMDDDTWELVPCYS